MLSSEKQVVCGNPTAISSENLTAITGRRGDFSSPQDATASRSNSLDGRGLRRVVLPSRDADEQEDHAVWQATNAQSQRHYWKSPIAKRTRPKNGCIPTHATTSAYRSAKMLRSVRVRKILEEGCAHLQRILPGVSKMRFRRLA